MNPSSDVWASFVEGMPSGAAVWRLDDPADDDSLRLVAANAAAGAAIGIDLAAAVGRRLVEIFPRSAYHRVLAEVARTGVVGPDDEHAYGDAVIAMRRLALPDRSVGVLIADVTERRRADVTLRESEARYRAVARATNDALWEQDVATGAVARSDAFAALFGYRREEVVGDVAWWAERVHPDDRARVDAGLGAWFASGAEIFADEYRFRRADGSWAHVFDRGVLMRGPSGEPLRIIGAMMDITQRKQLEGKLRFADRMASVGTLAAGVAHEINNPLSYLIANVRLVESRLRALAEGASALDPAALREALAAGAAALGEAGEGAERVHRIVADLKTFARAEEELCGPVDVRRVLEAALHLADHEIRRRARLVREIEDLPPVLANEARLGQVFLNLVVNAAAAIPPGAPEDSEIRVVARRGAAGGVVVEVRDTGPGLPAEARARLFEPFFAARSMLDDPAAATSLRAGTGLGLSVSHAIVTALGGELVVEGEPGPGSCFRVLLPAAQGAEAPPAATAPSAPVAEGAPRRGRILIVDDEPLVGRMVERALGQAHHVTSVLSGKHALARLESGERFDVILCDVMMPGMTGMDLYERVVALDPEQAARMVFLSGGAFTRRAREFLEQHPALDKPFDLRALEAVIQARLGWPA